MKFIVQRVSEANVSVDQNIIGEIKRGFLILVGISNTDTKEIADKMVSKLIRLRIFEDSEGKTNLDIKSIDGELLIISQFTLYADCRHGNRPSFINAGKPELANELSSSFASYKKVKAIADEVPTLTEKENTVKLPVVNGDIRFEHVSLDIEGHQILKDINFDLPKGKTLGIMGATGSGKSSIVNLLQRYYDPQEGRILLDGVDIRDMDLQQVRTTCAVVMQDVFLF